MHEGSGICIDQHEIIETDLYADWQLARRARRARKASRASMAAGEQGSRSVYPASGTRASGRSLTYIYIHMACIHPAHACESKIA